MNKHLILASLFLVFTGSFFPCMPTILILLVITAKNWMLCSKQTKFTKSQFAQWKRILLSMTSRNGSYKKMLPDHYPFGYAICNYTRNEHGMDVWSKIVADAGRYRTIIYPFSGAMKRHTGNRPPEMYLRQSFLMDTDVLNPERDDYFEVFVATVF